jgi:predicted nuclease of restriction endonuclease-like (RecB) superfamily
MALKKKNSINKRKKHSSLIKQIKNVVSSARQRAYQSVNQTMLLSNWLIGQLILEKEKNENYDERSSRELIIELSRELTQELGKGFSRNNLTYMRKLFLEYQFVQTVSGRKRMIDVLKNNFSASVKFGQTVSDQTMVGKKNIGQTVSDQKAKRYSDIGKTLTFQLSWSHYVELLKIDDDLERSFYQHQCVLESWSVRELQRQIESCLFLRLAKSKDKKGVLQLAKKGTIIERDIDIIRDPLVLEFLQIPTHHRYTERELETKLIDHIQQLLIELGRGFAFVGRQYRIPLDGEIYRADLVFYHYILKCFVVIDLKTKGVKHGDIGQMNAYLSYFEKEINTGTDNEPIGILLSATKNNISVEYALHGISKKIFVSKYQVYLPEKKLLEKRLSELL